MFSWWETPLCSKFLTTIADEIWSGQVVLAFLPSHTPNNFIPELKLIFKERDINSFVRINLNLCDIKESYPIESILHSHFQLEEQETYVERRVHEIFNYNNHLISELIIFENLSSLLIGKFKEFLAEYSRFAFKRTSSNRHKILVILDPRQFKSSDFAGEAGISKIQFEGTYDKLDQQLALRYLLELDFGDTTSYVENLITALSQFDYNFSEEFSAHEDIIDNCVNICLNHAVSNNWKQIKYIPINQLTENEFWDRWANGIAEKRNNERLYHTGYLAIHEKYAEINKRIWQAGLEILLPKVENIRQKILNCSKLTFPFKFQNFQTNEIKTNKFDFEVGEIYHMMTSREIQFKGFSGTEKSKLLNYTELCKSIRNDLAHMKTPKTTDITKFYEEFYSIDNLLST